MHRRGWAIALAGAGLLTAMSVATASAAVVIPTLSATAAPPGAVVTLNVRMSGRPAGTEPGVLFLIPVDTFGELTPCDQIEGATALGAMTWHAVELAVEGGIPGMASETRFTVPQVPDGAYDLAESWPSNPYPRHCFSYAPFTVDSTLPVPPAPSASAGSTAGSPVATAGALGGSPGATAPLENPPSPSTSPAVSSSPALSTGPLIALLVLAVAALGVVAFALGRATQLRQR